MTDIERAAPDTDWALEQLASTQILDVLTKGSDDAFVELADSLDIEEKGDAVAVLSHVSKSSSLRAGYLLYQMRQQTPDGEWGRKVYDYAEAYGVSERTIHRWMSGAQAHFGLELTPAQQNARVTSVPAEEDSSWLNGDEALFEMEGFEEGDPFEDIDPDAGYEGSELRRMNEGAGWGDETLPSADYEPPTGRVDPQPRPPAIDPDQTWVDFTIAELQREHDGVYSEEAARRMAVSRWAGKLEREPLELLGDLEMIYEAKGEEVPDGIADKLFEAEESKPIKPDSVEPPKKGARNTPKLAYSQAEKLLVASRNLHEYCFVGLRDGKIEDKEVAAMLPHLEGIPRTISGLVRMAKESKERVLSGEKPMEAKIAETVAAEEGGAEPEF